MKKANKRIKVTKESTIGDIAASVGDIAKVLSSIGKTHSLLLKSNEVIVQHLLSIEKKKKSIYKEISENNSSLAPAEKAAHDTALTLPAE